MIDRSPAELAELAELAEQAAERALNNLFRALGIDITRREELLELANALRWARANYLESISSRAWMTAWTMMLAGTLFGVASGHVAAWIAERLH